MPSLYSLLQSAQQKPKRQHSKTDSALPTEGGGLAVTSKMLLPLTLQHQRLFHPVPGYPVTPPSAKSRSLNRPALLDPVPFFANALLCARMPVPSSQPDTHSISPLQSSSDVISLKAFLNSTRQEFASFSRVFLKFVQTSVVTLVRLVCNSVTDQTISLD